MNPHVANAVSALRRAGHRDLARQVASGERSVAWAMAEAQRRSAGAGRGQEQGRG